MNCRDLRPAIAAALAVVLATEISLVAAAAAPTPAQKCIAAFETALGKAALCRLAAEAKYSTTLDATKLGAALEKCEAALAAALAKAASSHGEACPAKPATSEFQAFVAACSDGAVSGADGGALPAIHPCPAGTIPVGGSCWLLGGLAASCDEACSAAGLAYDDATAAYAGSGGTLAHCATVLEALSIGTGIPIIGNQDFDCTPFGAAVGCGQDPSIVGSRGTRCTAPPTTSAASFAGARRACACQ